MSGQDIIAFGILTGVIVYLFWLYLNEMREHGKTRDKLWKMTDRYHQARDARDRCETALATHLKEQT